MIKLAYVVRKNLKFEMFVHFMIAIALCLLAPVVFGLNNLDRQMAVFPLEQIIILTGVVIMVPIFLPEQERTVFDVMYTKQTAPVYVYAVRAVYSTVTVFLIPAVFTWGMYLLRSEVSINHYLGTVSSALFLGGIGALTFAITNNIAASYMLPVIYYVVCMVWTGLKAFDVMMMSHGIINGKPYQMAAGVLLMAAAVGVGSARRKLF